MHLAYAIPDHPWIDSADGAAVRIAMTVAAPGHADGILEKVITEQAREDGENEVCLLKVTPVTAKHRFFVFLNSSTLPDQALNAICINDAYVHGILSPSVTVTGTGNTSASVSRMNASGS